MCMCVCVFIYVFGVDVYVCMFETSLGFPSPNKEDEKKICEVSFLFVKGNVYVRATQCVCTAEDNLCELALYYMDFGD